MTNVIEELCCNLHIVHPQHDNEENNRQCSTKIKQNAPHAIAGRQNMTRTKKITIKHISKLKGKKRIGRERS